MKKYLISLCFFLASVGMHAEAEFGIIQDTELRKVGVKEENVQKAKAVITDAATNYKMLVLERREAELKVNKLMMEGAAKNLKALDALFDRIGDIESQILKERLRSQLEMQQYISQEQYRQARELAVQRLRANR